jgi:uncharacterized protein DUF6113
MRVACHAAALVLGLAVALASVTVHREGTSHLGLLLAVGTTVLVAWALRQQPIPHLAASYSAGWLVLFGIVLFGRPEGDYVIASDLDGYAMMVTGFVLVLVAVVSLGGAREPRSPRRAA